MESLRNRLEEVMEIAAGFFSESGEISPCLFVHSKDKDKNATLPLAPIPKKAWPDLIGQLSTSGHAEYVFLTMEAGVTKTNDKDVDIAGRASQSPNKIEALCVIVYKNGVPVGYAMRSFTRQGSDIKFNEDEYILDPEFEFRGALSLRPDPGSLH